MSKTTWVAVLLLVGTNAAWFLSTTRDDAATAVEQEADTLDLEQTITELQDEVARLRRAEPVLLGNTPEATPPTVSPANGPPATEGETRSEAVKPQTEAARKAAAKDAATQKAYAAALARSKEILRKIMQVEDPGLRAEGLRELSEALASDDPHLVEYALSSLYSLRKVAFDRSAFQQIVSQHLQSENGGIRRSALYAMHAVDPDAADPRVAIHSGEDPDPIVRQHTARLIALYGGPKLAGEAADVVVKLLGDENEKVRRGTLRGIANSQVTPAIEKRLIEMAATPQHSHEAVYFGLSQIQEKSRPVVDALFAHLEDENQNTRGRAHWGLQRGVRKDQQHYVATQYAERLGKFFSPKTRKEALQLIVRYGDDRIAPQLERFAENDLLDEATRTLARKAAAYLIEKKPAR